MVERVFTPIPIVPTRHNISIHRPHAEYRVSNGQPEFYMRLAQGPEPELELIRAITRGDSRQIEKLDELFGQKKLKKDALPIQRWVVAPGLYRFTLGTALEPGEYVLAEAVEDNGLNLYVWDFGVWPPSKSEAGAKKHSSGQRSLAVCSRSRSASSLATAGRRNGFATMAAPFFLETSAILGGINQLAGHEHESRKSITLLPGQLIEKLFPA